MSDPQERLTDDIKTALKAGDKEKLGTLRMLLTDVKNERIRQGSEVDETAFAGLIKRAIKQRHDAAEQYRRGSREDTAEKEEREAAILGTYLPEQAGEDEIRGAINELVESQSLSGPAAMGTVMREMMARFGARADGATLSRLAREILERAD